MSNSLIGNYNVKQRKAMYNTETMGVEESGPMDKGGNKVVESRRQKKSNAAMVGLW